MKFYLYSLRSIFWNLKMFYEGFYTIYIYIYLFILKVKRLHCYKIKGRGRGVCEDDYFLLLAGN